MKLPWFRLYNRIVDDEKLRLLAFEDRWHFIALCCLKSSGLLNEPEGELRDRKIAVKLGVQVRELEEVSRRLREVGLIDETLSPLAWDELQYRSDNSTDRVKKYREKQRGSDAKRFRNVPVTVQDTDTDTDTEKKEPNGSIARKRGGAKSNGFPMLDCTDPETWADFLKNRKTKRLPNTASAHRKLETDLAAMVARTGWPPGKLFAACVERGWGAIYDPRDKTDERNTRNTAGANHTAPNGRPMGRTEAAARAAAGMVSPSKPGGNHAGPSALPDHRRAIGYVPG